MFILDDEWRWIKIIKKKTTNVKNNVQVVFINMSGAGSTSVCNKWAGSGRSRTAAGASAASRTCHTRYE